MASKATSAKLLKLSFNVCFAVLFFEVLAVAEWIVVMTMMPKTAVARLVPLVAVLLGAQVMALMFYFWKPWVTVAIAWLGIFIVAARAIPWGSPSWLTAVHQFEFQVVFLIVAHAGFGLYVLMNRAEAEIVSEMVSGLGKLPAAENKIAESASADTQTPLS